MKQCSSCGGSCRGKNCERKNIQDLNLYLAKGIAICMAKKFYPHVPQWVPCNDLTGLLNQIENMTTGIHPDKQK